MAYCDFGNCAHLDVLADEMIDAKKSEIYGWAGDKEWSMLGPQPLAQGHTRKAIGGSNLSLLVIVGPIIRLPPRPSSVLQISVPHMPNQFFD